MKSLKLNLFLFIFVLLISLVFAADISNVTEQDAANCINTSKQTMFELSSLEFNTLRINDTIKKAEDSLDLQLLQMQRKKSFNFNEVLLICNEISNLKQEALSSRDQLNALLIFYNESIIRGMETEEINKTIIQIENEINDERYENIPDLITKCYNQITDARASASAIKIFTESTKKSIRGYLISSNRYLFIPMPNYMTLLIFFIFLFILFLIYRLKISKAIIQGKIDKLQIRKKTLKKLIMQIQTEYFHTRKISESEYGIKINKFSELIRDIDRQIPLLQEELARIESKVRFKKLNNE